MKKAAIFLDRDGVINVEKDYVHTIDDFEFIEDVIDALKILQDKGYLLVVVTNQSGIARGYYTEDEFLKLTEWMDWCLIDRGSNSLAYTTVRTIRPPVSASIVVIVTAVSLSQVLFLKLQGLTISTYQNQ